MPITIDITLAEGEDNKIYTNVHTPASNATPREVEIGKILIEVLARFQADLAKRQGINVKTSTKKR